MALFDFLRSSRPSPVASLSAATAEPAFVKDVELSSDVVTTPSVFGWLRSSRLPKRGTIEILLAYERSPYLRTAIHKISTSAATVPVHLYTRQRSKTDRKAIQDKQTQRKSFFYKKKAIKALSDRGELREIVDHPMLDLLENPGNGMRGRALLQLTVAWLDLIGDAFWIILTNDVGMPTMILPVPPHWVRDLPTANQPFFRVQIDSITYQVPISNMLWFRDPSVENPYGRGVGAGRALADELDTDENAAKHVSSFFYNRAMPDMLVGIEGADPDALERAKAKFVDDHEGVIKAHRSAFVGGKVTVTKLDTSFKDMDLINVRKFSGRDVVIQSLGLSPEMLGILDNSNRATVTEARAMFCENVIIPRLDLVCATLQQFAEMFDERLIVAFEDPTPDDLKTILEVAKVNPGTRTENEWRALQGLPAVDGGDVHRVDPTKIVVDRLDAGLETEEDKAAKALALEEGAAAQDSALNGAQVTALQEIAMAVARGDLPKPAAIALILVGFPAIDEAEAHKIIDPIKEGSVQPLAPVASGKKPAADVDPAKNAAAAAVSARMAEIARSKAFTEDEVDNVLEALRPERLTAETYDLAVDTISSIGVAEAAAVGAAGTFDMLNPLITSYLQKFSSEKIVGINNTTRDDIRAQLIEGVRAGEGIDDLAKRVESVFDDAEGYRATVIARTETIGQANRGIYGAHVMSGVVERRQWVGTPDKRSRSTHEIGSQLSGQVRPIGEKFESSSGAKAMHPGDFGVAKEDIQCRCTTIALVGEEPKSSTDLEIIQRDFEARVTPYEEPFKQGLRKGFAQQRADVLEALKRYA